MKIGPFEVAGIETGTSRGHGSWGIVTLERRGYEPCKLYLTIEEAETLREFKGPITLTPDGEKLYRSPNPFDWGYINAMQKRWKPLTTCPRTSGRSTGR